MQAKHTNSTLGIAPLLQKQLRLGEKPFGVVALGEPSAGHACGLDGKVKVLIVGIPELSVGVEGSVVDHGFAAFHGLLQEHVQPKGSAVILPGARANVDGRSGHEVVEACPVLLHGGEDQKMQILLAVRPGVAAPFVVVDVDPNDLDQMPEDVDHPQLDGGRGIVEEDGGVGPDLFPPVLVDSGPGPPGAVGQFPGAPIPPVGIELHPLHELLPRGREVHRIQQVLLGDAPKIAGVAGEPDAADDGSVDRSHRDAHVEQVIIFGVEE